MTDQDRPTLPPAYLDDGDVVLHLGDCIEVMAAMPAESIHAIVCDPPYGLEFMGKAWDTFRLDDPGTSRHRGERAGSHGETDKPVTGAASAGRVEYGGGKRQTTSRCVGCGKRDQFRQPHGTCAPDWRTEIIDPHAAPPTSLAFQEWCRTWATEALRVLKPGGHLLAFGGTRVFHRLTCGIEDAGFDIRDGIGYGHEATGPLLAWLHATGFPKSMDVQRAIDLATATPERLAWLSADPAERGPEPPADPRAAEWEGWGTALKPAWEPVVVARKPLTTNVATCVLEHGTGALNIDASRLGTDETLGRTNHVTSRFIDSANGSRDPHPRTVTIDNSRGLGRFPPNVVLDEEAARVLDAAVGGPSRFYFTAKPATSERDGATHPTVKPRALMRWLVGMVTPPGGTVLDPFAGSGTTLLAARDLHFNAVGIERDADYAAMAAHRLRQLSLFGGTS